MSKGDRVRKFNKEKFNTNYDNIFKKDVLTQKKPAPREEEEKMMREFYAEMKEQKIVELSEIVYRAVVDNLVRIDNEQEKEFYKINEESKVMENTYRGNSLYNEIEYEIRESGIITE